MIESLSKNLFGIAIVLILSVGGFLFPQAATADQTVSLWDVGTPIVTHCGIVTLSHFVAQEAVAGGYTMVYVTTESPLGPQMAIAEQYGLRTMLYSPLIAPSTLSDPEKLNDLNALIDQYKASPAAYIYRATDEPNVSQFAAWAGVVEYLRQRDPHHAAYINLFPNLANSTQLGVPTYQQYVDQYVDTVNPDFLSYDHYQLRVNKVDVGRYLHNLSIIATAARQDRIPFMQIVQVSDFTHSLGIYRVPTADEMRYLVYSSLAYGAQGIDYWKRWVPIEEGFGGGLVNTVNGQLVRTELFEALKPINREFVKIALQYQSLEWMGTYLKGYYSYARPDGTTLLPGDAPFSVSDVTNRAYSEGDPLKGIMLGFFGDGGSLDDATHALVTNLDYSAYKTTTLTGPGNLSVFNATTGLWTATGGNQVNLDLPPGGGVLVGLTSAVPEPSTIVLLVCGLMWLVIHVNGFSKLQSMLSGSHTTKG